jgi:hypothetical protein
MKFDRISENGLLWAARYDGMEDNILYCTFRDWMDLDWLDAFFLKNMDDLRSSFHITNIDRAIMDTLDDAVQLQSLILGFDTDIDLDAIFRPLNNNRMSEMLLGKEKAKGFGHGHASWLRLYAIKLEAHTYLITGGAIKLTRTMQEREHTMEELVRLEKVRAFLIEQGACDLEGMVELLS